MLSASNSEKVGPGTNAAGLRGESVVGVVEPPDTAAAACAGESAREMYWCPRCGCIFTTCLPVAAVGDVEDESSASDMGRFVGMPLRVVSPGSLRGPSAASGAGAGAAAAAALFRGPRGETSGATLGLKEASVAALVSGGSARVLGEVPGTPESEPLGERAVDIGDTEGEAGDVDGEGDESSARNANTSGNGATGFGAAVDCRRAMAEPPFRAGALTGVESAITGDAPATGPELDTGMGADEGVVIVAAVVLVLGGGGGGAASEGSGNEKLSKSATARPLRKAELASAAETPAAMAGAASRSSSV